jgi:hypothetical protein
MLLFFIFPLPPALAAKPGKTGKKKQKRMLRRDLPLAAEKTARAGEKEIHP